MVINFTPVLSYPTYSYDANTNRFNYTGGCEDHIFISDDSTQVDFYSYFNRGLTAPDLNVFNK